MNFLYFVTRTGTARAGPERTDPREGVCNAPLRAAVTACAGLPREGPAHASSLNASAETPLQAVTAKSGSPSPYRWAMVLARVDEVFPLLCPRCGEPMRNHRLRHRAGRRSAHPQTSR